MLEISSLVSGYGGGVVLNGISLSLQAGECIGLMGRNGTGKTTLLKTIIGLVKASSGSIMWDGKRIDRLDPFQIARSGIGYVPQGREIFGDLSIRDNLRLGNLAAQSMDEAFVHFPVLRDKIDALGGSLSGGQQQQLAIARVLLAQPRLLLLDEPSDGVQPSIVRDIGVSLKTIARERQMAMLLVEQNADLVLSLCDRVLFLDNGQIIADHQATNLKADPGLIETAMAL